MTYTPEQLRCKIISELADEFCRWPLPQSVCSDTCVSNPSYPHQRTGTNLLTHDEAKQMFTALVQPILNSHAAALEEVERLKAAHLAPVKKGPLRDLGAWLATQLDDDKWPTAETYLNAAEAALAEYERKIERLKFHAEGMWLDLKTIAHEEQYALAKSAADYRASFPKE